MEIFNVAYFNWYDKIIQFSEEEAESGLEAMKEMDGLYKLDHLIDEEKYFKEVEKRGGLLSLWYLKGYGNRAVNLPPK